MCVFYFMQMSSTFDSDSIVDESGNKTFGDMIKDHLYPCFPTNDDQKHGITAPKKSIYTMMYNPDPTQRKTKEELDSWYPRRKVTGHALFLNEVPSLSVVDIDIPHEFDDERKESIRASILSRFSDSTHDVIEKTGSGGLHIYAINDVASRFTQNRYTHLLMGDDYNIDIFVSGAPDVASQIIIAGSRSDNGIYEYVLGDRHTVLTRQLSELMTMFDVPYPDKSASKKQSASKRINQPTNQGFDPVVTYSITDDLQKELIDNLPLLGAALKLHKMEIHARSNRPFVEVHSLLPLLQTFNSFSDENKIAAYASIKEHLPLTDNARMDFDRMLADDQLKARTNSPYMLTNFYRAYMPQDFQFKNDIKAGIKEECELIIRDIDFKDPFTVTDIVKRGDERYYVKHNQVLHDLSRIYRYIDGAPSYAIKKVRINGEWRVETISDKDFTRELKNLIPFRTTEHDSKGKSSMNKTTAWDIYELHKSLFMMKDFCFNSPDPDSYNAYRGWLHQRLDKYDFNIIKPFIRFVYETVSSSRVEVFEYLLKWIAFITQHPGQLTGNDLILKGQQGVGKNTFTNVIAKLFIGYSNPSISDIKLITGGFNSTIENLVFAVCNEIKDAHEIGRLKEIITEPRITINKKFMPTRSTENVTNFVFLTNEIIPFAVSVGARRDVVLRVNPMHQSDHQYWCELNASFTDEFYDHLLTFFMDYPVPSNFHKVIPPDTEEKVSVTHASMGRYDSFIQYYFKDFVEGIQATALKRRVNEYNIEQLANHSITKPIDYKRIREYLPDHGIANKNKKRNGVSTRMWFFVDDKWKDRYAPLDDEDEEFVDDDDDASIPKTLTDDELRALTLHEQVQDEEHECSKSSTGQLVLNDDDDDIDIEGIDDEE